MNHLLEWLLRILTANLPPQEREAIRGDLNEMRFGVWASLREVIGLVVRQELQVWTSWRVWLGVTSLVTLVAPSLIRLSRFSVAGPFRQLHIYSKYGVLEHSGLSIERETIAWFLQTGALLLFIWAAGKAFGRFLPSGAISAPARLLALWIAWICFPALRIIIRGAPIWSVIFSFLIYSAFFLLPALRGASNRGSLSQSKSIALLAATIAAVALLTWTSGWWQTSIIEMNGGYKPELIPWYTRSWPWLLAAWPAAYISLNDLRKERRTV